MSDDPISEKAVQQNHDGGAGAGTGVVDELHQPIHESAQTIHSLMLFVLLSAAYVLIVVGGTTDMMLLRKEEIILPFIQVGMPIVAFYVAVPLLLLFLHCNLLARLILLARDIHTCFDNIHAGVTPPKAYGLYDVTLTMLFPIDPVRLMWDMRKATLERTVFGVVFLIQVGTIPMLVLLLQARFLVYQDEWITLFHQIVVTIDLLFQLLFMLSYNRLWRCGKKLLRTSSYLVGSVLMTIPALFVWMILWSRTATLKIKSKAIYNRHSQDVFSRIGGKILKTNYSRALL